MNESESKKERTEELQPTPWYFYVMALAFCIIFVLCITYCAVTFKIWQLMFFYVIPLIAFCGL